uniref:Secreted protein n=1 Tax=Haemonchus contortus TaxID=6289 RepID=A0A7I4Y2P7_HAECO
MQGLLFAFILFIPLSVVETEGGSTQGTNENVKKPMSANETTLGHPEQTKGSTQGTNENVTKPMSTSETTSGHPEETTGSNQKPDEKGTPPRSRGGTSCGYESKGTTQGTNENAISPISPIGKLLDTQRKLKVLVSSMKKEFCLGFLPQPPHYTRARVLLKEQMKMRFRLCLPAKLHLDTRWKAKVLLKKEVKMRFCLRLPAKQRLDTRRKEKVLVKNLMK